LARREKARGFFDGVEVLALEILDEGEFEDFLVGGGADDGGGFQEADFLGGAPAAFAGDELEFIEALPDDEGLDDAVLADGIRPAREAFRRETPCGAGAGGSDVLQLDHLHALAQLWHGSWRGHALID